MPQVTNATHSGTPANTQYQQKTQYGSHVQYGTNKGNTTTYNIALLYF